MVLVWHVGVEKLRSRIAEKMKKAIMNDVSADTQAAFKEWIESMFKAEESRVTSAKVIEACKKENNQELQKKF